MGVLSAVVPSSGRFLGGGTKRGRLWVGKWAFVGWRRGVSSEAISLSKVEAKLTRIEAQIAQRNQEKLRRLGTIPACVSGVVTIPRA